MLDQGLSAISSAAALPLKLSKRARKYMDPLLDVLTQDPSQEEVVKGPSAREVKLLEKELQQDSARLARMAATWAADHGPEIVSSLETLVEGCVSIAKSVL